MILASCVRPSAQEPASGNRSPAIVSLSPAATAILIELGAEGSIVACDTQSRLSADVPRFDMIRPDAERILALKPSLILVSGMTRDAQGADPFEGLSRGTIRVEYLPTSQTIADIERDIHRIAFLIGDEGRGESVVSAMRESIDATRAVTRGIPSDKRPRVLFELAPSPSIYSFGSGVYLDEALEAAGAKNALSEYSGWLAVSAETILARDPDVIFTNVDFLPDPVAEIMGRPGWVGVTAVREGRVFRLDADASSQPAPMIAQAIRDMARLLHPEAFRD